MFWLYADGARARGPLERRVGKNKATNAQTQINPLSVNRVLLVNNRSLTRVNGLAVVQALKGRPHHPECVSGLVKLGNAGGGALSSLLVLDLELEVGLVLLVIPIRVVVIVLLILLIFLLIFLLILVQLR